MMKLQSQKRLRGGMNNQNEPVGIDIRFGSVANLNIFASQ
jgi:hypothetical protein